MTGCLSHQLQNRQLENVTHGTHLRVAPSCLWGVGTPSCVSDWDSGILNIPIFVTKHRLLDFGQPSQNGEAGRLFFSSHLQILTLTWCVWHLGNWVCCLVLQAQDVLDGPLLWLGHARQTLDVAHVATEKILHQLNLPTSQYLCVVCLQTMCLTILTWMEAFAKCDPHCLQLLVAIHEHEESVTSCHGRSRMGNSMGRSSNSPTLPPTLRWEIALNQQQLLNILRCLTKSKEKQLRVEGFHPLPYSKQP